MSTKLFLLGAPRLQTDSGMFPLERKTAAVLAYLALEGATAKYKLAGWLWPESGESTARNNMRQLLRRLRLTGGDIVQGQERIELVPHIEVDVRLMSHLETPNLEVLTRDAPLLEGFDYDDAPDFADWLDASREELENARLRAASIEAGRLERSGNLRAALDFALIRLRSDALSEEAYRQVARIHYLLGDRGAALSILSRCRDVLEEELGAEPAPETIELMKMIRRGSSLASFATSPAHGPLPAAILRPPILAGRESEWAQLEEAWQAGKLIFIRGEPGVGKSRLAMDFLASKGSYIHLSGRPGDSHVPYSSNFRHLRTILARYQDDPIPPWVRRTLAPWLPELGAEVEPVEQDAVGQARFAAANLEIFGMVVRHGDAMFVDDLQFQDDASNQLGMYLLSAAPPGGNGLTGYIGCYRSGEEAGSFDAALAPLLDAGIATVVTVGNLEAGDLQRLLEGLELPGAPELAAGLLRYTGGNPMFVLETVKHLVETNTLAGGLPARLAPPGRVAALVQRRLQRLSPAAQNLARAAAIAGSRFSLELAAYVLDRPAIELAAALDELENAQVLKGSVFVHDLIFEAVLGNIPAAVEVLLHSRVASYLETVVTEPGAIAQHWLRAGRPDKAVPWLLASADRARRLGLYEKEASLLERAAKASQDEELLAQIAVRSAHALTMLGRAADAEAEAKRVLAQQIAGKLRIKALDALQNAQLHQGKDALAARSIDEARELAERLGDEDLPRGLLLSQALLALRLGRHEEALSGLEKLLPVVRSRPLDAEGLKLLSAVGAAQAGLGRHEAARALQHEVIRTARELGSAALEVAAASYLLSSHDADGTGEEALPYVEDALSLGHYAFTDQLRLRVAEMYLLSGRLDDAERHLDVFMQQCTEIALKGIAWALMSRLRASKGDGAAAEEALASAVEIYETVDFPLARFSTLRAVHQHGSAALADWAQQQLDSFDPTALPQQIQQELEGLRIGRQSR